MLEYFRGEIPQKCVGYGFPPSHTHNRWCIHVWDSVIIVASPPFLTFIAKSKVAELDVSKDADLENFRGVDHVEEHGVLLFSVGLHNPTVLVTFDAGMQES